MRAMQERDWQAVAVIFEEGIRTRNATFETAAPAWADWDASHLAEPRLVAEDEHGVTGWAALTPVSSRCCYAGVADVSIYVAERARGRGVGRALLAELVRLAEDAGLWTLQSGVFPENEPSLRLHAACGFRRVGVRDRLGRLDGTWRDVVLLERRSERW